MTKPNAKTQSNGFDCSGAKDGADANDSRVREAERREFWKACFVSLLSIPEMTLQSTGNVADDCLTEFDRRW